MRRLTAVLLCVAVGFLPLRVGAAALSGILIYAADQAGNPSGWDPVAPEAGNRVVWHTQADGTWNGLGILAGAPPSFDFSADSSPRNLQGALLNAPDFTIDLPLFVGENELTLLGEPDRKLAANPFDSFVLNLYFDGTLDAPGISVLFPRRNAADGEVPEPNQSNWVFTLGVAEAARGRPAAVYDNGSVRVSVETLSFGPAPASLLVDRVSASAPSPNGLADWIGGLTLLVEGSPAAPSVAGAGRPGVAAGPVDIGSARVGPDLTNASAPVAGHDGAAEAQRSKGNVSDGVSVAMDGAPHAGTPSPEVPTPNGTVTPAATAAWQGEEHRTPSVRITVSATTPTATTPTAKPSPTAATSTGATPTPVVQSSHGT
jgi:hypothetical protein